MIGITSYSTYVPRCRLARERISQAWGGSQPSGEIAVAQYDEDALTMATEAALACSEQNPESIDGVYFASTSAPYREKQVASVIATACDLTRRSQTADFSGSARAGVSALLAALNAVGANARRDVVVAAAECRLAAPESEIEGLLGDAGAALRVGNREVIAEFVGSASISEEFTHLWRTDEQRFLQAFPGRFSNVYGYVKDVAEAIETLLAEHGMASADIARLAVYSPDPRAAIDLAKRCRLDPKKQLAPVIAAEIGSAGCADPLLALGAALDEAKPGDWLLVAGYGEGADALLFRATEALVRHRARQPWSAWLAARTMLPSYEKYLKYRRIVEVDAGGEAINNVLEHKELKQDVRLYGTRCGRCGTVQYPIAQVCIACKGADELRDHKLGKRGTVFTFTIDHLIANLEHPLPMAVIDLDGGGRVYLQVTDFDGDEVTIGTPVQLTYRRLHEGGGNYNYFWKARPLR